MKCRDLAPPDRPPRPYQEEAVKGVLHQLRATRSTLLVQPTGCGKALRNDQRVLTRSGWRPIADLVEGEMVIGRDGRETTVVGVFPQGMRPMFEVSTNDGATVVCDADHLWSVRTKYDKQDGRWQTLSLRQIMEKGLRANGGWRWELPNIQPADLGDDSTLPIEPYLLGVLLGDGHFSTSAGIQLTTQRALAESLSLPAGVHLHEICPAGTAVTYRLSSAIGRGANPVKSALRAMGLLDVKSRGKWIPDQYFWTSASARLALLRGLMDTDGYAGSGGSATITLASERLAADVRQLVLSLGGRASIRERSTSWLHKGIRRHGRAWRVQIAMMDCPFVFKAGRYSRKGKYSPSRRITGIRQVEPAAATCIKVDATDQLFVTEDYIVTHNTYIFSMIAAMARGRVLVLAGRRELLEQAIGSLADFGVAASLEQAEEFAPRDGTGAVVASVQTMQGARLEQWPRDAFSLIIVDEAHHATAVSYRRILDHFESAKVLGVTATPNRTDGVALGEVFESVAMEYSLADAIRDGWLVPIRDMRIIVKELDLSSVKLKKNGDFQDQALSEQLEREEVLHGMLTPLLELAGDRPTLVFCASVAHAEKMAAVLTDYTGHPVKAVSGETDAEIRRQRIDDFRAGRVQFLCSCNLLLEGFDAPPTSCVAMCRMTKSTTLYTQAIGRGTRLSPGKGDLLVLNFEDNSAAAGGIVSCADVLAGKKLPDEKRKIVDEVLDEQPDLDMLEALDIAEQRYQVTLRSTYHVFETDPLAALGLTRRNEGWPEPPTDKQISYLEKVGVPVDGMSKRQCSDIIERLIARRDRKLCTYKQMRMIRKHTDEDPTDMTFDEARALIDRITAGWR